MKLNERLKRTEAKDKGASPDARRIRGQQGTDPLVHLKRRAQEALFAKLGARLYDPPSPNRSYRSSLRPSSTRPWPRKPSS